MRYLIDSDILSDLYEAFRIVAEEKESDVTWHLVAVHEVYQPKGAVDLLIVRFFDDSASHFVEEFADQGGAQVVDARTRSGLIVGWDPARHLNNFART